MKNNFLSEFKATKIFHSLNKKSQEKIIKKWHKITVEKQIKVIIFSKFFDGVYEEMIDGFLKFNRQETEKKKKGIYKYLGSIEKNKDEALANILIENII